jgi:phosphatidylglycerol:prolipoprotein diacylglycerol transferase
MNPEMFHIGALSIRWYSVLILTGILVAIMLANKESKKFKLPEDFIFNLAFYVVICGIIGARIYYVLFNLTGPDGYLKNPMEMFMIWHGGLAVHGSIIGGFIALFIYCKKNKVSILRTTDFVAPGLLIAQAIGRWGNFFNSEAFGPSTTYANLYNLHIPKFIINGMYINGIYYHPTFFYESIWCLIGFILILLIRRFYKYLKKGQLTCFYLMWYSVGRLFIEYLRTDSLMLGKFKVAQLISIIMFTFGLVYFIYLCFNKLSKDQYYNKKLLVSYVLEEENKEKEKNVKKVVKKKSK